MAQGPQSMTQAEKAAAEHKEEDLARKTYDLVQYLLLQDHRSYIKRIDINKVVLKEYLKCFNVLMERATTIMKNVYGLNVIECVEKKGHYIVVDALKPLSDIDIVHNHRSQEDVHRTAILLPILGFIFMKGNLVRDDALMKFLQKMLNLETKTICPVMGDLQKLIHTDLTRQGYLDVSRIPDTDPVEYNITWGFRARQETTKMKILDFVSEMYGNEVENWPEQFQEADEERENTVTMNGDTGKGRH